MVPNITEKITEGIKETRRILRLTRKPRYSEFSETAKITGLGTLLIGGIGFVIFIAAKVLSV